jgi:hypothetical protein
MGLAARATSPEVIALFEARQKERDPVYFAGLSAYRFRQFMRRNSFACPRHCDQIDVAHQRTVHSQGVAERACNFPQWPDQFLKLLVAIVRTWLHHDPGGGAQKHAMRSDVGKQA